MNKRLKNRHHMIRAVMTFLNEHEDTFKDKPHYAELLANMHKHVEGLENLRGELDTLKTPFASRKELAWKKFVHALTCLNRMMKDFATATSNVDLLVITKEVGPKLGINSVNVALNAAHLVVKNAELYLADIKGLSRGEEAYNEAVAAYASYSEYGVAGRYRRNTAKELNARFEAEQQACLAYIRGPVETFFYTWSVAHPELYAQFRIHRLIPDLGSRRAKTAEDAEAENASDSSNTASTTEVAEGSTAEAEDNTGSDDAEAEAGSADDTAADDGEDAETLSA